ncbi:MAG: hydrolase [Burkholderiales bacterium]
MPDYRAPWWLPGGHLQTVYPSLVLRGSVPPYRRTRWETPDADFIDIDWIDAGEAAPMIVLFHGLEGSSRSHYATAMMRAVAAAGWRGAVVHFRGCSGEPNRLPRAYHSGDVEEIHWILERFRRERPGIPIFAAGVSLGANALLKWLGRPGSQKFVAAAAAISAPVDLACAGDRLGQGLNAWYGWNFLRTLKTKSLEKLSRFPGLYDAMVVSSAGSLRAFDNVVTAPLHGFRDTDDYWARAAAKPDMAHIELPTLVIHAHNDPFLPGEYLPSPSDCSPRIEFETPSEGGHAGFVSGRFPGHLNWMPQRVLAFFRRHIDGP